MQYYSTSEFQAPTFIKQSLHTLLLPSPPALAAPSFFSEGLPASSQREQPRQINFPQSLLRQWCLRFKVLNLGVLQSLNSQVDRVEGDHFGLSGGGDLNLWRSCINSSGGEEDKVRVILGSARINDEAEAKNSRQLLFDRSTVSF